MKQTTRHPLFFSELLAPIHDGWQACAGTCKLVPPPVNVSVKDERNGRILIYSHAHGYAWANRLDLKPQSLDE